MNRWNSIIEIKHGQCIDCPLGVIKPLATKERCDFHNRVYKSKKYRERTKNKKIQMLNDSMNVDTPVSSIILWYGNIMLREEPVCWNCGCRYDFVVKPEYKSLWHSAVAHILPKYLFKSVKDHPLNYLILFAGYSGLFCSCHDIFDKHMENHDWDKLKAMKVWPLALERFRIMEPHIALEERRHIPEIFLL